MVTLRSTHSRKIAEVLGLPFGPSYYRDIYVWLPDVRWGVEAICHVARTVAPTAKWAFMVGGIVTMVDGLPT